MQWKLSGAGAGDSRGGELKDTAEAVAEEESDGYILDLKDGSDLDRGSDFETAAEERRRVPVSNIGTDIGMCHAVRAAVGTCCLGDLRRLRRGRERRQSLRGKSMWIRTGGISHIFSRYCGRRLWHGTRRVRGTALKNIHGKFMNYWL